MWPFSTRTSAQRDDTELREQFRELEQRFKVIEREHEDLHRAYRKLRGTFAAEAREAARPAHAGSRGNGGEDQPGPLTKDDLRRKFLTPGLGKPKPSPETD
jgi:hypothetical protein